MLRFTSWYECNDHAAQKIGEHASFVHAFSSFAGMTCCTLQKKSMHSPQQDLQAHVALIIQSRGFSELFACHQLFLNNTDIHCMAYAESLCTGGVQTQLMLPE